MEPNQLTNILTTILSGADNTTRQAAEQWLEEFKNNNFPLFIQVLAMELANNEKPANTRGLAGIIFKNSLTLKDPQLRNNLMQRWLQLDVNLKSHVKASILSTLSSPDMEPRAAAAQVISSIANIELPNKQWTDLIQILLTNMQQENDYLKQGTLQALGYICEEIDSNILESQANQILTAVCKGIRDPNNDIKYTACTAMYNALEFVRANFEKEVERNYIMQVLCEAATTPNNNVRVAAYGCFVKIASLYYDKLAPYMQKLFNLTLGAIEKDVDEVALQAIEFWSTICDEEIEILEETREAQKKNQPPTRQSHHFIMGALKFLVQILTICLTKQEDEPDEDTWNVAMAAGTCLSLMANAVEDEIVQYVLPFVSQNINSENWKFREAATLAFGSILEGPKKIGESARQAIPILLQHMKDPVVYVKDTTAWTLGRVCQLHPQVISEFLEPMLEFFLNGLSDSPRVASSICWAIHNISIAYEDSSDEPSSPLSRYYPQLLQRLIEIARRDDASEDNLRVSAYEAINVLIQNGARDTLLFTADLTPIFIDQLKKTFQMQILSIEDKEEQVELQSLLCGVLQTIIQRVGLHIKQWSDEMMNLFLQVFNSKNASVHEEALMAIGAIANAVESDFEKYMAHFRPFLIMGLKNYQEYQVCAVAVGVVGDISRALNNKIYPFCDEIVTILLEDLQNPHLHRNVKPPILSCFGDIALAIGKEFVKYLNHVMTMLQQASMTKIMDTSDYDLVDYLNQLREGIFEAYTGIIQGLRSDNSCEQLLPFIPNIFNFVSIVYGDKTRNDAVTRGAVGVLGDIGHAFGSSANIKMLFQQHNQVVYHLINECLSSDGQTKDIGAWTKEIVSKIL
jgi:importin subunit beta-1